ncbi:nipped-B-like protein A [Ptychodera flava]|uniref:nipped-B-like protein A n=1 Tax=Ptychodera flava TaxID=63121 RepID=UPI00396A138B
MMNGEIPSVPITTLAGVNSLTDLLPELPLPSPLPATLGNKSLLFNNRVADEARRLLSTPDENLVPQLLQALSHSSTDHIELKDKSIGDDIEGEMPALLQAILTKNPNVFKQKTQLDRMGGMSPRQPMAPSPYYQQSPDAIVQHSPYPRGHTSMQGSPSAALVQGSPSPRFTPGSPAAKFTHSSPQRFPQSPNKFQQYAFQQQTQQQNTTQGSPAPAPQASINGYPGSQYSPATAPSPAVAAASPGVMSPPQSRARPVPHSPGAAVVPSAASPGSSGKPYQRQKQFQQQFQQQPQHHPAQNQEGLPKQPQPLPQQQPPKSEDQIVPVVVSQAQPEVQNNVATPNQDAAQENNTADAGHSETLPKAEEEEEDEVQLIPMEDTPNRRRENSESVSSSENGTRRKSSGSGVKSGPVVLLKPLSEADKALAKKSASAFELKSPSQKGPMPMVRLERLDLSAIAEGKDSPGREKLSLTLKKRKADRDNEVPSYDISCPLLISDEPISPPSPIRRGRKRKRSSESRSVTSSSAAEMETAMSTTSSEDFPSKRARKGKNRRQVLDDEEMMEGATFKRFCNAMETVFENSEEMDLTVEIDEEDGECSPDLLISKALLLELSSQAAKLKSMGVMSKIPPEKLVRLLNILERNIRDGCRLQPTMNQDDEDKHEQKLWRELTMERVTRSIDASLTAMYIMTSPNMPKHVYIEDVIERMGSLVKFQLQNTIYPEYDPVYRINPHERDLYAGNMRMKRARASGTKEKSIIAMYNKLCELVSNLADLIDLQPLTDTSVLLLSTIGLAPFFVENVSELQLSAMKVITGVFSGYEKHRQLILEDIFASLARLPSSKKNLRNFRLNSEENIQMVTALVLQLIQCIVTLPVEEGDDTPADDDDSDEETAPAKGDLDKGVVIINLYETALRVAQNFLSVFLKKCVSKDEEDYRPLFENFVQDLLSTVNKPEWPAAEVLLSLLGRLLVHHFSNRSNDMTMRVSSLDYLGQVASRLRRDAVSSQLDESTIDAIVDDSNALTGQESDDENDDNSDDSGSRKQKKKSDKVQSLQRAMLHYLALHGKNDPALLFARQFYIAQWFRDSSSEVEKTIKAQETNEDTTELLQAAEQRKLFLISMIKCRNGPFGSIRQSQCKLSYENAALVARYLTSNRPFSQSFDIYLSQILRVLSEQAVAVRTRAVRCLTQVVEADPSMLARPDMEKGVHGRFMDHSTSVREAAVELVGRFVLKKPELIPQYYDMLIERILDTGISVRKRVIKILRDICIEHPDFPKVPEMCVKMIRRVNDEEGIKKLVNETFQKMWFTPVRGSDSARLIQRVHHITDVVTACKDTGYEWFEQLLCNSLMLPDGSKSDSGPHEGTSRTEAAHRKLLRGEEDNYNKPVFKACEQIVDCLVENVLRLEEKAAELSAEGKPTSSHRLVSCMQTLYLFVKVRPELLVSHATTLQPYLSTKCSTQGDYMLLFNVAKTLELVVPLMDHPSEVFLATLEEDLMKLIIKHGQLVLQSCVSCLASVVNNVTHNYKLVKDCFQKFFGVLSKIKNELTQNPGSSTLATNKPSLCRSLFTVGLFCRHFNFEKDIKASSKVSVKDRVLEVLLYFVHYEDEEIQLKALQGLGFFCITYSEIMLGRKVKELYNGVLDNPDASVKLKVQVLRNLTTYLTDEEERMRKADAEWKKVRQEEDLKEMGDIHSGMSSTVMQIYLKVVMEEFFHTQSSVRMCALQVVNLILRQGLVHPVQCVPYLVAIGTDFQEPSICVKADQQLSDIDSKYPGFIHMKALAGIRMSFRLQRLICADPAEPIRGIKSEDSLSSLCSHLYTLIRSNRQHRRALLLNLLNLFDEQAKNPLGLLVYVADNLAHYPYLVQDEPLFIMHHIEIVVSVSGANLLQSFKECLFKKANPPAPTNSSSRPPSRASSGAKTPEPEQQPQSQPQVVNPLLEDEDEEDVDILMTRVPEDPTPLIDCCIASQACMVLLVLKQHLKDMYGFRDSTIHRYSPTESAKVYDKALNRKQGVKFEPARALEYLRDGVPRAPLSDRAKRDIVNEYLDFKQLMEVLDPAEDDELEETGQTTPKQDPMAAKQDASTSKPIITQQLSVVLERHEVPPQVVDTASTGEPQGKVNDSKDGSHVGKDEEIKDDASYTGKDDASITGKEDAESTDGGAMPHTPANGNMDANLDMSVLPLQASKHKARAKPKQRRGGGGRKPKPHKKRKKFSLDYTDDSDSSDPDFRA